MERPALPRSIKRQTTGGGRGSALVARKRAVLAPLTNISENVLALLHRSVIDRDRATKPAISWIEDEKGTEVTPLTYSELWKGIGQVAHQLRQKHSLRKGDTAVVVYETVTEFAQVFLGCLAAGVVPLAIPSFRSATEISLLVAAVGACSPSCILADVNSSKAIKDVSVPARLGPLLRDINFKSSATEYDLHPNPSDVAYLQLLPNSGEGLRAASISHSNLSHNLALLDGVWQGKEADVLVSWLPMSSAAGLVGTLLNPLCRGNTAYYMSPGSFWKQPALWMKKSAEHKATVLIAPESGYDAAAQSWPVQNTSAAAANLSQVRMACVVSSDDGIHPDALHHFEEVFGPLLFDGRSFVPVFSSPEHTFYVADRRAQSSYDFVELATIPAYRVGCGATPYDVTLKVVDPKSFLEVPEGEVGEIWVDSPSKSGGWWNLQRESEDVFRAPLIGSDGNARYCLRTGELGRRSQAQIVPLGRLGAELTSGEQLYFAHDVELAAYRAVKGKLRYGGLCCVQLANKAKSLVLVAELAKDQEKTFTLVDGQRLASSVGEAVGSFGVHISRVVLVRHRSLPKLDLGTPDRFACREALISNGLRILHDVAVASKQGPTVKIVEAKVVDPAVSRRKVAAPIVMATIVETLGPNAAAVTEDTEMATFLDSIVAARVQRTLQERLKITIPPEIFFESATVASLITNLAAITPNQAPEPGRNPSANTADGGNERAAAPVVSPPNSIMACPAPAGLVEESPGPALSLMFFSSNDEPGATGDKYRLYLEAARYADESGFEAIWTPERHFHRFGGVFPNATQASVALCQITRRARIRMGSIVLPLHDPLRVAEETAVVDCLSNGRFDTAIATGWNLVDFALAPEAYTSRREVTYDSIARLRLLWEGKTERRLTANGQEEECQAFPRPIQRNLNLWLTSVGNERTIIDAAMLGMHLLTALLFQSVEQLELRIKLYRQTLALAGFDPTSARVTLMLHTYVGPDMETVHRMVKQPFCDYLRSSISLWRETWTELNAATSSKESEDLLIEQAYHRYIKSAALIGTPESVTPFVRRLLAAGVDEIACLIDFGVSTEGVLSSLPHLASLLKTVMGRDRPAAGTRARAYVLRRREPAIGSRLLLHDAPDPFVLPDQSRHRLLFMQAVRKITVHQPGRPTVAQMVLKLVDGRQGGEAPGVRASLTWLPGQYICVFLLGADGRPTKTSGFFSVARATKSKLVMIIAESRDPLSRAMLASDPQQGLRVAVDSLGHGYMFVPRLKSRRTLLLGAGTAISPLLAIHQELSKAKADVVLLASVKSQPEVKLYESTLGASDPKAVIFTVTQPVAGSDKWTGNQGRLGQKDLIGALGGFQPADVAVYISGPSGFLTNMWELLLSLKVPAANILTESSIFDSPAKRSQSIPQTEPGPPQQQVQQVFHATARHLSKSEPAKEDAQPHGPQASSGAPLLAKDAAEPLAIVGVAGRFPGSNSWSGLFDNLLAGASAIRGSLDEGDPRYSTYDRMLRTLGVQRGGGFLADVDAFDASFFKIRDEEAQFMDPQQRLLLELSWEALCDAGFTEHTKKELEGPRLGVFVGTSGSEYKCMLVGRLDRLADSPYMVPGLATSMAASRISFWLGSSGPSEVIDTSCTSSFSAIAAAAASLRASKCNLALVGAANVLVDPATTFGLAKQGLLCSDEPPECRPFDSRAHGYVRGEGVGVIVLKLLSQAQRDGDYVHAVIRSVSGLQAGRRLAMSLPTSASQVSAIQDALREAKITAADVDVLEAQAIGTSVGDSFELKALATAYGGNTGRRSPLTIGASKANIGHCEAASGLAGLLKLISVMARRVVPPNINWTSLPAGSADILSVIPATLPSSAVRLPPPEKQGVITCAIHSYAQTGAVAHLVLQSFANNRPWVSRYPTWKHATRYWLASPIADSLVTVEAVAPDPEKSRLPVIIREKPRDSSKARAPPEIEQQVMRVFADALSSGAKEIDAEADLFKQLGGTSMTAIAVAERVNDEFGLSLDVAALFDMSSVRELSSYIAEQKGADGPAVVVEEQYEDDHRSDPVNGRVSESSLMASVLWAVLLLPAILIVSLLLIFPVWPAMKLCLFFERQFGLLPGLAFVGVGYLLFGLALCFEMLVAKWVLIGRYRVGSHSTRSFYYYRWWVVDRLFEFGTPLFVGHLKGTPLWNIWLLSLGAAVDLYSHIDTTDISEFDLVRLGRRSTIEQDAVLRPGHLSGDLRCPQLVLYALDLAEHSYVGHHAMLRPGRDGGPCGRANLGPLSTKSRSMATGGEAEGEEVGRRYGFQEVLFGAVTGILGLYSLAALSTVAFYPAYRFTVWLLAAVNIAQGLELWNDAYIIGALAATQAYYIYPFLTVLAELDVLSGVESLATTWYVVGVLWVVPAIYLSYALAMAVLCTIAKWVLFMGRAKPVAVPRGSAVYMAHWFISRLICWTYPRMLLWLNTWVGSLWLMSLGASVNLFNGVAMDAAPLIEPDLVQMGTQASLASGVALCPVSVIDDVVRYSVVRVPDGCAVGLHGVILGGDRMPAGCIVGALTAVTPDIPVKEGTGSLLGVTSFPTPTHKAGQQYVGWWRRSWPVAALCRWLLFNFVYMLVQPVFLLFLVGCFAYPALWVMAALWHLVGLASLALIPLGFLALMLTEAVLLILLKWLLVQRFTEMTLKNAESTFFNYRRLAVMHCRAICDGILVSFLLGTPWSCWLFNALGARVSSSAVIMSGRLYEPDLILVGPNSVVERNACISPHMRDGTSLTMATVRVGAGCSIRAHAVVLYGVQVQDLAVLLPMSLAVTSQTLLAGRRYRGVPSVASNQKATRRGIILSFFKRAALRERRRSGDNPDIDWAKERCLPADLMTHVDKSAGRAPQAGEAILLTGATGYFGPYLLAQLLEHCPEAAVYCLVRGASRQEATDRLASSCARLRVQIDFKRVRIVLGTLEEERLGADEAAYAELVQNVRAIVHNGAAANFALPYRSLKPSNVGGTLQILRLAAASTPAKAVHYISSCSVFSGGNRGELSEHTPLTSANFPQLPYAQTKRIAEELVTAIGSFGVPVAVYRLANLGPDSQTGVCNTADFVIRLLCGCSQLESAPKDLPVKAKFNVVPVDYAARVVAALVARGTRPDEPIFHVTHPEGATSLASLLQFCRSYGYRLADVAWDNWVRKLNEAPKTNALYALRGTLTSDTDLEREPYNFACEATASALAALPSRNQPPRCPPLTESSFHQALAFCVREGLLPAPIGTASERGRATKAVARPLRPLEAHIQSLTITTLVRIKSPRVTPADIRLAYACAAARHPYLRLRVAKGDAGASPEFEELDDLDAVPLEHEVGAIDLHSWRKRWEQQINAPRGFYRTAVVRMRLITSAQTEASEFYWTICHAATDSRGAFVMMNDMLVHLGSILDGNRPDPRTIQSRDFVDIVKSLPLQRARHELPKADGALPPLPPEGATVSEMQALFAALSVEETTRLLARCKERNATPQSVLTAATLVGAAYLQREKHPLPQRAFCQLAVQLRNLAEPPLPDGGLQDSLAGGTPLWWISEMRESDSLWGLSCRVKNDYEAELAADGALKFFAYLRKPTQMPTPTAFATNIGLNPISLSYGKALKLDSVDLGPGNDGVKLAAASAVIHAQTFGGMLRLVLTYTYPAYTRQQASDWLAVVMRALRALADHDRNLGDCSLDQFFSESPPFGKEGRPLELDVRLEPI